MNYGSQIDISNTKFNGLRAYKSALIISAGQSTVSIEGTEINNCTSTFQLISHHFSHGFSIKDSIIINSSPIAIWDMMDYEYLIQNVTFYSNGNALVDVDTANGYIQSCRFIGDPNEFSEASALRIGGSTTVLVIDESDFEKLRTTSVGGAIYAENARSFTLTNSNFLSNEAVNGGAI